MAFVKSVDETGVPRSRIFQEDVMILALLLNLRRKLRLFCSQPPVFLSQSIIFFAPDGLIYMNTSEWPRSLR